MIISLLRICATCILELMKNKTSYLLHTIIVCTIVQTCNCQQYADTFKFIEKNSRL